MHSEAGRLAADLRQVARRTHRVALTLGKLRRTKWTCDVLVALNWLESEATQGRIVANVERQFFGVSVFAFAEFEEFWSLNHTTTTFGLKTENKIHTNVGLLVTKDTKKKLGIYKLTTESFGYAQLLCSARRM